MLSAPGNKGAAGGDPPRMPRNLASGGTFRSFDMRLNHILGLLSAAAMSVALAGAASAQDKTVKIGAI
jgi:hypothetical protein